MTENRDNDMLSKEVIKPHRVGGKSKMPILLRNVDQKSKETVFLIAIWQSKTLFLSIFDQHLSIVDDVFNAA